MKSETKTLKKVKIDEHIKNAGKKPDSTTPRKRGRPRKIRESLDDAQQSLGNRGTFNSDKCENSLPESDQSFNNLQSDSQVIPVHDTTEEAKAFLRAPFDIAAGLTDIPRLALYPSQLEALAPTFKPIYDKYIVPSLGEHAMLYAFGVCFSGVLFEKVAVFKEVREKRMRENANPHDTSQPFIKTEHVSQQTQ